MSGTGASGASGANCGCNFTNAIMCGAVSFHSLRDRCPELLEDMCVESFLFAPGTHAAITTGGDADAAAAAAAAAAEEAEAGDEFNEALGRAPITRSLSLIHI